MKQRDGEIETLSMMQETDSVSTLGTAIQCCTQQLAHLCFSGTILSSGASSPVVA